MCDWNEYIVISIVKEQLKDWKILGNLAVWNYSQMQEFLRVFLHWMSDKYLFWKEFIIIDSKWLKYNRQLFYNNYISFFLESDFPNLRVWNDLRKIVILTWLWNCGFYIKFYSMNLFMYHEWLNYCHFGWKYLITQLVLL